MYRCRAQPSQTPELPPGAHRLTEDQEVKAKAGEKDEEEEVRAGARLLPALGTEGVPAVGQPFEVEP